MAEIQHLISNGGQPVRNPEVHYRRAAATPPPLRKRERATAAFEDASRPPHPRLSCLVLYPYWYSCLPFPILVSTYAYACIVPALMSLMVCGSVCGLWGGKLVLAVTSPLS